MRYSWMLLSSVVLLAPTAIPGCGVAPDDYQQWSDETEALSPGEPDDNDTNNPTGSGGASNTTGGTASTGGSAATKPGSGGTSTGGSTASSGGTSTGGTSGNVGSSGTMYVSGRHLYDRCGEHVVLRGINEMVVWSGDKDGIPEYAEIAKTGANSVRIVWNSSGSAGELDRAISNAVAQKLIPMPEHHGATGDLSRLPSTVDYWTRSDVVNVLKKHEHYLLLNIANESGGGWDSKSVFIDAYKTAINRIRGTGLKMPLIIDAPAWGQDIDMLQSAGPTLIQHDPEKNVMLSVHMWWDDSSGSRVRSELQESVNMNLPLIVGEFANQKVCGGSFAYKVLLAEAQKHQIGYYPWSWGGVNNGDCGNAFDMTHGGTYGNWEQQWAKEVAVTDPNSIQNTSVRPHSMVHGSCR
jgi:mannan endo-1,4-beta-mannosidase